MTLTWEMIVVTGIGVGLAFLSGVAIGWRACADDMADRLAARCVLIYRQLSQDARHEIANLAMAASALTEDEWGFFRRALRRTKNGNPKTGKQEGIAE